MKVINLNRGVLMFSYTEKVEGRGVIRHVNIPNTVSFLLSETDAQKHIRDDRYHDPFEIPKTAYEKIKKSHGYRKAIDEGFLREVGA